MLKVWGLAFSLRTPLHKAILYGHLGIIKLLIENGSEINLKDKDGNIRLT